MTLGKKIKELNKKGFSVSFYKLNALETVIELRRNGLATVMAVEDYELQHNDCGVNKIFERLLRIAEKEYLDKFSCKNCALFNDDSKLPKPTYCFDICIKPYFTEK